MPRPSRETPSRFIALFATGLIVFGVVAVVIVSSQQNRSTPSSSSSSIATSTPPSPEGPRLVLANENAITLFYLNGATERLSYDAFSSRHEELLKPLLGVSVANGTLSPIRFDQATTTDAGGFISPDGLLWAIPGTPQKDGASVVLVSRASEAPQKIVLRENKGNPIADATILGWIDAKTLAVMARSADARWIFFVDLAGKTAPIAALPENMLSIDVRYGSVWYVTATMGEGLESSPQGPSDVHRLAKTGEDSIVATDKLRAIVSVIPESFADESSSRVAYMVDSALSFVAPGSRQGGVGESISIGKRRPLLFLPDHRLVVRDGYSIVLLNTETGTSTTLGSVPEGSVDLYLEQG